MEDGADSRRRRQLEFVGDCSHLVQHLEWPKVFEAELVMRAWRQGSLDMWLEPEVDHVADVEGALRSLFVGLMLHALLCSQQMLAHSREHGGALHKHSIHIGNRGSRGISYTKMTRGAAIEYLKRRATEC